MRAKTATRVLCRPLSLIIDRQPETREVNFLEMRASTETDIAALEKNGKRETFWP
jgi:hypothetical protein